MSSDVKTLAEKLADVSHAVSGIAKQGRNETLGYSYVRSEDVVRQIREELHKARVVLVPKVVPGSLDHFTETGGKSFLTTLEIDYTLVNLDIDGDQYTCAWLGAGADVGGDKGLYKAYTGALKYFLLNLLLIPTGDDPEKDQVSEQPERQPAPRIPSDRAKLILEQAMKVGLASQENGVLTIRPVLIAKLADVGVDTGKIGHLNVDAAEDVEQWLSSETKVTA